MEAVKLRSATMAKQPYLPLFTGDWLKDPALSRCTPATRGVWIDLLCRMHESHRSGQTEGTTTEMARLARCTDREFVRAANELQTTGTADVQRTGKTWRICNRRMAAEADRRKVKATMQKQRRFSARGSPVPEGEADYIESEIEIAFERFWFEFPSGRRKSKKRAREAFEKALEKTTADELIEAAKEYAMSDVGRGPYVQMPSTWLNQECWTDDREAWRDKSRLAAADAVSAYAKISASEFRGFVRSQSFRDGPIRNKENQHWVYGTLRDGRKVECKDYPVSTEAACTRTANA